MALVASVLLFALLLETFRFNQCFALCIRQRLVNFVYILSMAVLAASALDVMSSPEQLGAHILCEGGLAKSLKCRRQCTQVIKQGAGPTPSEPWLLFSTCFRQMSFRFPRSIQSPCKEWRSVDSECSTAAQSLAFFEEDSEPNSVKKVAQKPVARREKMQ